MEIKKLMLIPPNGPSGPFYGAMGIPMGPVIALQMADKRYADFLIQAGNAALCDFQTIEKASVKLYEIMARDFPNNSRDEMPIKYGEANYVIRAVMESLFGQDPLT